MKLHHMLALSAALLTLTACTAQVVQPAVDNSAAPVVETAAPVAPAATPAPLAWQPCAEPLSADLECAQMQVPMDYAAPDSPTVTLGLTRVKATDADKRIGSLIINPGGPGGAGSDILNVVAQFNPPFTARLREYFDLVGYDPRGVGLSTPVKCDPASLE